jgi:hypothetical protein
VALPAHVGPYAVRLVPLDSDGRTIGRTDGVSALAQPLVICAGPHFFSRSLEPLMRRLPSATRLAIPEPNRSAVPRLSD